MEEQTEMNALKMKKEDLERAIFQAVMMWSDSHYERFLFRKKPGQLDEDEDMFDWFEWFVSDWRVARTIKKGKRNSVRGYLDKNFREQLKKEDKGCVVDEAARIIKERGWSAKESKSGNGPRSLVSKIGFFLTPDTLIPYDRFARDGLREWQRKHRVSLSKIQSYSDYLTAFNEGFESSKKEIRNALTKHWVKTLAKRFRCPVRELKSLSFQRKVFDNYLMEIGVQ
jgi:hypothetical protein